MATPSLAAVDSGSGLQLPITGNRSISTRQLTRYLETKQVSLEELSAGDTSQLERARRLIRIFYQRKGYPLARVDEQGVGAGWSLRVNEGPRARLGSVLFEGNRALPAPRLRGLLGASGRLDFDRLEAGLDRIRHAYRDAGYPEVDLETPRVEVVERTERDHFPLPFRRVRRQRVRLTVPLEEGAQYRFGAVPPHPDCADVAYPERDEVYSVSRLLELRNQLQRCFFEQGRLLQDLQVAESFQSESNRVDLRVHASLLPPLEIGRIEFRGHQRFPDPFYRRELLIEEGRLLDPRLLEASLSRLLATGALRSLDRSHVELALRDRETVDINIELEERDPRKVEFSLGPDGLGGVEASLAYTVFNLLGLGEKMGLDLNVGSHSSEAAVGLASRYLLGTQIPAALALRFFRRNTSFRLPGVEQPLQRLLERDSWGFEGGGSYRVTGRQQALVSYSFERVRAPIAGRRVTVFPQWEYRLEDGNQDWLLRLGERLSLSDSPDRFGSFRTDVVLGRQRDPGRLDVRTADFRFHFAYGHFFGRAEPLFDRLFRDSGELRTFALTAGPWAELPDATLSPVGGDTLWSFSTDYQLPVADRAALVPFFDLGAVRASSALQPGRILADTDGVLRASLGTELRLKVSKRLPTARLIAAWRPLRLDTLIETAQGPSRLRESPFAIKIVF